MIAISTRENEKRRNALGSSMRIVAVRSGKKSDTVLLRVVGPLSNYGVAVGVGVGVGVEQV
jgi:hypothetical protein